MCSSDLAAFEKDGFDAKKLDLSMAPGKKAHDMIDQHVQFFSGLLGIVKPEQRDKLAATMERPGAGGFGKPEAHVGDRSGFGMPFGEHAEMDDD